ncbi:MAG: dihydropteroate synthase [Bacteroidales bacterium]
MERSGIKSNDTFFQPKKTINCRGRLLTLERPLIMGILNITPDSFYDGGKYISSEAAIVRQTSKMLKEGADIIDIGAMSTRPGAKIISIQEEKNRLIPVLQVLTKEFPEAIFSVDTFRSQVAQKAAEHGAAIINDVSGGCQDPEMFETVARLQMPYVMMHMQGTPANMQKNPQYDHVIKDIGLFFAAQLNKLKRAGVHDIILDPGFGFGKSLQHNYQLLAGLHYFSMFELPLLVGVSRKSMINKILGTKPADAINGTTALNVMALERGAGILRVHDVREAREAVTLVSKLHKVEKLNMD